MNRQISIDDFPHTYASFCTSCEEKQPDHPRKLSRGYKYANFLVEINKCAFCGFNYLWKPQDVIGQQ